MTTTTISESIASVHANADQAWKDEAAKIIRILAESRMTFSSDVVLGHLARLGLSTHDNRALGAIFRMLSNGPGRIIEHTGEYRASRWACCHNRPVRVWRGVAP